MRKILFSIFASISLLAQGSMFAPPVTAQIDITDPNQSDICVQQPESTLCQEAKRGQEGDPIAGDNGVIEDVINVIALATSTVSVIVIIIAGLTFVTSNGDASKVKSSRDAIIYALLGLVVVALARYIIMFVINNV